MKKEKRITAVYYNELDHYNAIGESHAMALLFKEAKNELETILEKPIENYTKFKNDVLGYSIASIKAKFPKAFDLGLPIEKVLAMLSIDLQTIEKVDATLKATPHKFCVCAKTGEATADESKDDFIVYATTDEQHQRLDFANELVTILEKAHTLTPHTHKANMKISVSHIVSFDMATESLIPNHWFVMNGIK